MNHTFPGLWQVRRRRECKVPSQLSQLSKMNPIQRLRLRLVLFLGLCTLALATLIATLYHVGSSLSYQLSLLLLVLAAVLRSRAHRRDGVMEIPPVKGHLPGNIDVLWRLIRNERIEYCADTLRDWERDIGPTYDLNILWGHQVLIYCRIRLESLIPTSGASDVCLDSDKRSRQLPGDSCYQLLEL
jgi:hypothetical protein